MSLRRVSLASFVLALCALPALAGCSRQGEGERCSLTNADSDCEDGLLCTEAATLRDGVDLVDRCCPDPDSTPSDSRCELKTTAAGGDGDGDGSDGGAGGMSSEDDGTQGLGTACQYTSDCLEPLVCGPSAVCQHECNESRDCEDGEVCTEDQVCAAE